MVQKLQDRSFIYSTRVNKKIQKKYRDAVVLQLNCLNNDYINGNKIVQPEGLEGVRGNLGSLVNIIIGKNGIKNRGHLYSQWRLITHRILIHKTTF